MLLYCSAGMIDEFWNNSELYEKNLFDTMHHINDKRQMLSRGVFRIASNIYHGAFPKIENKMENKLSSLVIFAKKSHHRYATGF